VQAYAMWWPPVAGQRKQHPLQRHVANDTVMLGVAVMYHHRFVGGNAIETASFGGLV